MVGGALATGVVGLTLVLFGWVALRARARDIDGYLLARGTQGSLPLGLSFLASGMGAWILFAPPEVGAFVGLVGVVGYALGAAAPIALFGIIGRRVRSLAPGGHSLPGFVRQRFGSGFHLYVVAISVLYMLVFLTAELTAIGGVTSITSRLDPRWVIVAVAAITAGYTAYGGLPASLRTDRWQAWLILAAVAVAFGVLAGAGPSAGSGASFNLGLDRIGFEVALTLIVAVTAANLFHQGYWQRMWAARDELSLARGAALGAALTVPVVALVGIVGIMAALRSVDLGEPPVPFFALAAVAPAWLAGVLLVLGLSLVASSVDTLQNAIVSLAGPRSGRGAMPAARSATVAIMVVPVIVALQGFSVLRLFLIADLLCAATAVPVLSGLGARPSGRAAIAGSVAGLIGAFVPSWVAAGSISGAVAAATFATGVPTIGPFAGALASSAAAVVLVQRTAGRESASP